MILKTSQNIKTVDTFNSAGAALLESVLFTEELHRRPPRLPDYEEENCALVALVQEMANSPQNVLQKLVDIALHLCQAHSAGVSILEREDGREIFRWHAVAGQWSSYIGGTMPREISPCGTVLDRDAVLLMSHPECYFPIPTDVVPPITEVLLIPFHVAGEAVGTVWVIAHDETRKFDMEDERLMNSLAQFASSAYQLLASRDELKLQVNERKKVEVALRRSDAMLRNFVETATTSLHRVGADGIILWANQAELDLLGYAREEYIGHHVAEFYADQPVLSDILSRLDCGETLREYEARLRCKDGSIRHVLIDSSVLFEEGKFVHTRCFTRDVTDRKRAEAQLQESERRFRAMIDALPAAVYTTDAEGRLTHFNPAAVALSGRAPDLGTDRWCVSWKLFRPDGTPLPHDKCPMAVALTEGRATCGEELIVERPDGERIWIAPYPTPIRDAEGRIMGGINMLVDITERKRAEEDVHRRTAQFETLLNAAPLGVYLIDGDFCIRAVNPTALKVFDMPDLIGRDLDEVLHVLSPKTHADEVVRRFRHTLETGEPCVVSEWIGERLERKVRTVYDWQIHRIPLPGGGNGVVCYFQEVTAQIKARDELRESGEQLRTLASNLETQVQTRTEELKQRNTEVQKQAEELRELSQQLMHAQDEERRHLARELHDSAGQMLASLGMNLATIVQNAKRNFPQPVDAAEGGQRLVQQLSQEIRTMSYLLHPPLLDEAGLPEALRLYLQGLADRGSLDISLNISENFGRLFRETELAIFRIVQECLTNVHRHSGSKNALVRICREADSVLVEVEDTGKGISTEKLTAVCAQGAGVGITGMRERIRRLGGHLSIESQGVGTKLSFTFPVSKTAAT